MTQMQIIKFSNTHIPQSYRNEIASFLHEHLQQYGDAYEDISKALDYVSDNSGSKGGHLLVAQQDDVILGAVVINKTGMSGYIPENILVYIAVNKKFRGEGLGKKLMTKIIEHSKGDIALHVEANNPAKILYEKLGFTNPYLEMRLKK